MMALEPKLKAEIGPDGLAREAPVIVYTEKIIEEEQIQLRNDYAGDVDDRRSTPGYVFMLGGGVMTKADKLETFEKLRERMGVCSKEK